MRMQNIYVGGGTLLLTLVIGNVNAADTQPTPTTELAQMSVTVLRDTVAADKAARALVVKTAADVAKQMPAATPEMLATEPNISLAGGTRAGMQEVVIRGLGGKRVLQTVDGARQSFFAGHRPSYFLDSSLLKSVEVLKGPAGSLWGSGAIGGVVAQQTVAAGDILRAGQQFGGFIKHSYFDNGEAHQTTAAAGARTESIDLLGSVFYKDSHNIEQGKHHQQPTEVDGSAVRADGGLLKGTWQIDDYQQLGASVRQSETQGMVPSNGAAPITNSNQLVDRNTDVQQLTLDYQFAGWHPWLNVNALLYRNDVEMSEWLRAENRRDDTRWLTTGFHLSNRAEFKYATITLGVDGYRDEVNASRNGAARSSTPDAEINTHAWFAHAAVPLWGDALRAELGLRRDSFQSDAKHIAAKSDDSATSESLALIWQPTEWLALAARYDEAFRSPSTEEMFTTGTHFCMGRIGCNTFVPNPDLEAETAKNKELLATMQWNDVWLSGDTLQLSGSVFRNDVDKFIELYVYGMSFAWPNMSAGHTSSRNVDAARIDGHELTASYQTDRLRVAASYGKSEGVDRKTDEYLSGIPASKWSADVSYQWLPDQLTTGLRVTVTDDQERVPSSDANREYENYTVTDLYASFKPAGKLGERLQFDAAILNVTDQYYRYAFQELYQPGRELRLSATYRF